MTYSSDSSYCESDNSSDSDSSCDDEVWNIVDEIEVVVINGDAPHNPHIPQTHEPPIICCVCEETLSSNEDYIGFGIGNSYCMECAEDLEQIVSIETDCSITDDESQ